MKKLNFNFWAGIGLIVLMLMFEKDLSDWVLVTGSIVAVWNIVLGFINGNQNTKKNQ